MTFDKCLILVTIFQLSSGSIENAPVHLDLNEINLVQYDVRIEDQPIIVDNVDSDSPAVQDDIMILPMTNKHGQKYQCQLPKPKEVNEGGKNFDPSKPNDDNTEEEAVEMSDLEKAKKLLQPMASQPCLLRTKDWWTYELCYGKFIRQFHMEEGKPSGPILHLGYYHFDKELDEDLKNSETKIKRHHTQIYANGSNCDLTGNARQTEVRFECDPTSVMDAIIQVDEPQSCQYVITVLTSKICAIPHLRPPPVHKPVKIECRPLLTSTEYEKYQNYLKVREKNTAKKAEEIKDKHKASLLKALDGEDISHIDVTTDEGMSTIEEMVGGKLADKLVNELGAIFGKPLKPKTKLIQPENGGEAFEVEEIKLRTGEMQSKPVGLTAFQAIIKDFITKAPSKIEPKKKEVNLDPRSDLSNEDEIIQELVDTVKKMTKDEMEALHDLKSTLKKNVQDSIEDIVEETEGEMNLKLDGLERHNAINELHSTFQDLMSKLDKAEADINKVNEEIEQLHDTIDGKDEVIDKLKEELDEEQKKLDEEFPTGASKSPLKEPDPETAEPDMDTKVNIKVTNFGASHGATALKDSPSEKRVIKHLERAIKDKLFKAGLDTGGRQIEVKFITTSIPSEVFGGKEDGGEGVTDESMTSEEARQFQGMIYNLMVGNQDAYEDIDNQRKTEKSYHFATSASDFEDEAETEVDETVQPEVSDDPVIPTDEENIVK